MSKHHDLKCDPAPFAEVKAGRKLSELRLNDRDYQSGDTVTLREYNRDAGQYTGDTCGPFTIGHILRGGYFLPEGVVMFSLLRPHPVTPEGETPETDALYSSPLSETVFSVMRDHARRLERERNEARAKLAAPAEGELAHAISDIENMEAMAETPQVAPYLHNLNSASVVLRALRAKGGEVGEGAANSTCPTCDKSTGAMVGCPECDGTGFYGEKGPGIEGNQEFQPCECTGAHALRSTPPKESAT